MSQQGGWFQRGPPGKVVLTGGRAWSSAAVVTVQVRLGIWCCSCPEEDLLGTQSQGGGGGGGVPGHLLDLFSYMWLRGAMFWLSLKLLLILSWLSHLERWTNFVTCNAANMHAAFSSRVKDGCVSTSKWPVLLA